MHTVHGARPSAWLALAVSSLLFTVAVSSFFFAVESPRALAQSCSCEEDVADLPVRIQRSLIVLEGTVTAARRDGATWRNRVRVVRVHAGYDLPREVDVSSRDTRSACGIGALDIGKRYLFLGSELSTLAVSACNPPVSMETIDERLRVEDVISDATAPRAGCASCSASGTPPPDLALLLLALLLLRIPGTGSR